ncbi:MAG: DUF4012 domain-containing protein [Propionibacteriaceae bacterium]|nr:DUF4012 domain-containing protein [Propionibacteriaceae bacterium]
MSSVEPETSAPGDELPVEPGTPRRAAAPQPRRRWPWVVGTIALVLIALVGLGAWLGTKVLTVRDELTAAQGTVDELRDGDMKQALTTLAEHGERATEAAHDPVWGAAEHLPWAGENLRAARLAAETLDAMAGGLGVPALEALQVKTDDPMLARLLPVLQESAPRIHELSTELQQIRGGGNLVSQLRDPVDQIAEVIAAVDPVLQIVPGMLGAEGERNYLLVAQNNAETLALGGSAASQSLIRFADGSMKIVKQADSQQYQRQVPVDVDIDQSAIDLYNDYLIKEVNTAVGRPDWPTAAKTIIALWNRDIDPEPVDGAISVDPLALSRIMRATGPVTVDDREINADNAVSFLLSEAYALYRPEEADAIFKQVALAVMDSLVGGDFEPAELWSAISESIDAGSLMFWSADPEVQEMIAPWRLSGILPTTNLPTTTIGVFFRDASLGSKIDYYLRTEADVTSACETDGSVTYTVLVTVWLDLSRKHARTLPPYVIGGELANKTFRTQVFLYGPPGTEVTEEFREGGKGTWNWRPLDMHDLGRPTPSFMTTNPLGGDTVTVGVTFTGPPGEYGPVEVRATPMVHPTKVTIQDTCTG